MSEMREKELREQPEDGTEIKKEGDTRQAAADIPEKEIEKQKKKKEKYVDDGSTIVDMSFLDNGRAYRRSSGGGKNSFRECFRTYVEAVKMMLIPMLCVIGVICVAFLIMWLLSIAR